MKGTRVIIAVLVVFLFAAVVSLAGGQQEAEAKAKKLTVAMAVNTSDYKTAEPLVRQWAEESGVEVEIIEENTQTYVSTYILAAKTGKPKLDVVMFWDFYIDQLYPMLTPIDGSHDREIALSKEDAEDFIGIGLTEYKGHIYIIPYSLDVRLLYYRKDLLEQAGFSGPPETWNEMVDYAQALTKDLDGDGNIDQWGFASICLPGQVFNTYTFFDFLFQKGGSVFSGDGRPAFNSDGGVEALQFMVDLRNKYKVMPPDVITYDNNEIHEGFLSGKFAMVNHWPYLLGMSVDTAVDGKIGYAYEAKPPGGRSATVFNRWGFGIPKMSENKQTALELIKYVTSTQSGIAEFSKRQDWPLRRSVYLSEKVKNLVPGFHLNFSNHVFEIAEKYATAVMLPRGGETSQILGEYIDRAMVGEMSAKEALDSAAAEIKALLQD